MKIKHFYPLILTLTMVGCTDSEPGSELKSFAPINYNDGTCNTISSNRLQPTDMEQAAIKDYYNFEASSLMTEVNKTLTNVESNKGFLVELIDEYEQTIKDGNADSDLQQMITEMSEYTKEEPYIVLEGFKLWSGETITVSGQDYQIDPNSLLESDCVGYAGPSAKIVYGLCAAEKLALKLREMDEIRELYMIYSNNDTSRMPNDAELIAGNWALLSAVTCEACTEDSCGRGVETDYSVFSEMATTLEFKIDGALNRVENVIDAIDNQDFGRISIESVPYISMVMSPAKVLEQLRSASDKLTEFVGLYEETKDIWYNEETQAISDWQSLSSSVEDLQIEEVNGNIQSIVQTDLTSQLNSLQADIQARRKELELSKTRMSSNFTDVINKNLGSQVAGAWEPLTATNLEELTNQTISLELGSLNTINIINQDPEIRIVANGIYEFEAEVINSIRQHLSSACHWEWYVYGLFRDTYQKLMCRYSVKNRELSGRDYEEKNDRIFAEYLKAYEDSLKPWFNVRRRLTNGFSGYFQNVSENYGTSSGESTSPDNTLAGLAGAFTTAGVSAIPGVGPIAGPVAGALVTSALTDRSSTSTGTSYGQGVGYEKPFHSPLAKYPEIRLGMLVAEIGCDGVFNTVGPVSRTAIDSISNLILLDENYAENTGPLGEWGLAEAVVRERNTPYPYYAVGNSGLVTVDLTDASSSLAGCATVSMRLIVNDATVSDATSSGNYYGSSNNCGLEVADGSYTNKYDEIYDEGDRVNSSSNCTFINSNESINLSYQIIKSTEAEFNKGISVLAKEKILNPGEIEAPRSSLDLSVQNLYSECNSKLTDTTECTNKYNAYNSCTEPQVACDITYTDQFCSLLDSQGFGDTCNGYNPDESGKLALIAYSEQPEVARDFIAQRLTAKGVHTDVAAALMPLVDNFINVMLGQKALDETLEQRERLMAQMIINSLEQEKVEISKEFATIAQDLSLTAITAGEAFQSTLVSRLQAQRDLVQDKLYQTQRWFSVYLKSLEFHQVKTSAQVQTLQDKFDSVFSEVNDYFYGALDLEADCPQVTDPLDSTKTIDFCIDTSSSVDNALDVAQWLTNILDNDETLLNVRAQISQNAIGYCEVNLANVYGDLWAGNDASSPGQDPTLPGAESPTFDDFVVNDAFAQYGSGLENRSAYVFKIPRDAIKAPSNDSDTSDGNCIDSGLEDSSIVPKLFGAAIVFESNDVVSIDPTGLQPRIVRTNLMSWYQPLSSDSFYKVIDYSFVNSILGGNNPLVSDTLGSSVIKINQLTEDTASCRVNGSVDYSKAECIQELLPTTLIHDAGGNFSLGFVISNFNSYIGNEWAVVIPKTRYEPMFTSANGIDSMKVVFYYYKTIALN